ncbi:hypothetical protein [Haloarchaeobius litoreus]|uniref:Uncharacterized protein n=1 Tax=Haloarchaeobius litoreus TaxID=755306 RepID=A0ABD6DL81_9EURY|nr:hypothetical protein [Haloarchaeobius litoreus]
MMPSGAKRKMARKMLDSTMGQSMLQIVAHAEHELISSVVDLQSAADLADEQRVQVVPDPEDRQAQLRQIVEAKLDGRFPEWWVVNCSGLDNAEEAAEKVDVDWHEQKERWAELLRENGTEGETDTLAASYVRSRYDCTLDEFRTLVVDWPDGGEDERSREAEQLKQAVASGLSVANQGIQTVTEELEGDEDE